MINLEYDFEITAFPNLSMVKSFDLLPEEKVAQGALICFVKEDILLARNIHAILVSYL